MAKDKICTPFLALASPENKFTVSTIDDLKSRNYLTVGDIVDLNGYYTAGDGAGHKRKIEEVDDGSGVQLANGLWANIVHNGEVNVSWFGAKGDDTTDDSDSMQKALDYCGNKKVSKLELSYNKIYQIHNVYFSYNFKFEICGNGCTLKTISKNADKKDNYSLSIGFNIQDVIEGGNGRITGFYQAGLKIKDLTLTSDSNNCNGIIVTNLGNFIFENITALNSVYNGIVVFGVNTGSFKNCSFDSYNYGLYGAKIDYITNGNNLFFTDNFVDAISFYECQFKSGVSGMYSEVRQGQNLIFKNCFYRGGTSTETNEVSSVWFRHPTQILIEGGWCEFAKNRGSYIRVDKSSTGFEQGIVHIKNLMVTSNGNGRKCDIAFNLSCDSVIVENIWCLGYPINTLISFSGSNNNLGPISGVASIDRYDSSGNLYFSTNPFVYPEPLENYSKKCMFLMKFKNESGDSDLYKLILNVDSLRFNIYDYELNLSSPQFVSTGICEHVQESYKLSLTQDNLSYLAGKEVELKPVLTVEDLPWSGAKNYISRVNVKTKQATCFLKNIIMKIDTANGETPKDMYVDRIFKTNQYCRAKTDNIQILGNNN